MKTAGLIVFDVDGTLIRGKTVCELIADQIGKSERMSWLERHAGASRETVISAREEMADWYFEAGRHAVNKFLPTVSWAPEVRSGVGLLMERRWHVAIASMTWKFAVEQIATELGITELTATGLDWDSAQIDHVFRETKAEYLDDLARRIVVPRHRVVAVGDSDGDVPMLIAAGHGIYVGQSDPELTGVVHMPGAGIGDIAEHVLNLAI
ncbi:MAG: HAD-IB family phosphatase [Chloroflexi bacterium]|nr:HAD-IB family phosphatase [Chloroflexota bacterium]